MAVTLADIAHYLDKQGVDENGRRKLFEEVQAKKWFGD